MGRSHKIYINHSIQKIYVVAFFCSICRKMGRSGDSYFYLYHLIMAKYILIVALTFFLKRLIAKINVVYLIL